MDLIEELRNQANMRGLAGDAEFRAATEIERLRGIIETARSGLRNLPASATATKLDEILSSATNK